MRLILDTTINNADLPLVDPVMGLINDNAIGIYGMLDKSDTTGKSGALITSALFDSQGVVLDGTASSIIQTPVKQTDEMTIIYAWQLARPSADIASVAVNNLSPGAQPYSGFRLTTQTTGNEYIQSGTGRSSPAVNQLQTTHTSGATWVAQAVAFDATRVDKYYPGSASVVGGAWQYPPVNAQNPFYLNGSPDSLATPTRGGYTGKMGLVAFYNKKLTADQIQALLSTVVQVMAGRGITI